MKKLIFTILLLATVGFVFDSCSKSKYEELYPDPAKTSTATVENFMTGVFQAGNPVNLPAYWRYFVIENSTSGHYTQAFGWVNGKDQYIPSSVAQEARWGYFYDVMRQYREMQDLYNQLSTEDQADKRIFMIAATVFMYDQTEQMVDMWGDIPWSEAGKLKVNGGDLTASLPKYDNAIDIYTAMLDDLKSIADELPTITLNSAYASIFTSKDYINNGDILGWRKYVNSLRLRMLARVSGVSSLSSRVSAEMTAILGDPTKYPVVDNNAENILIDAKAPDLLAITNQYGGIKDGLETWGTQNFAPKAMIDLMNTAADPRLPVLFDPSLGIYEGIDPTATEEAQSNFISANRVARYDSVTFSRNDAFPGIIITAAEVSFIKAEAIQKGWVSGDAKTAYETGIQQSIDFYYGLNELGSQNLYEFGRAAEAPYTAEQVTAYLESSPVKWDGSANKMQLIATQKWLHFNIAQLTQNWSELRRLNLPALQFQVDGTSAVSSPPVRFVYPSTEKQLNGTNYEVVASKDNYTTKIFWDVD